MSTLSFEGNDFSLYNNIECWDLYARYSKEVFRLQVQKEEKKKKFEPNEAFEAKIWKKKIMID